MLLLSRNLYYLEFRLTEETSLGRITSSVKHVSGYYSTGPDSLCLVCYSYVFRMWPLNM